MNCPACTNPMTALGYCDGGTMWHCQNCGTVRHHDLITEGAKEVVVVPRERAKMKELHEMLILLVQAVDKSASSGLLSDVFHATNMARGLLEKLS